MAQATSICHYLRVFPGGECDEDSPRKYRNVCAAHSHATVPANRICIYPGKANKPVKTANTKGKEFYNTGVTHSYYAKTINTTFLVFRSERHAAAYSASTGHPVVAEDGSPTAWRYDSHTQTLGIQYTKRRGARTSKEQEERRREGLLEHTRRSVLELGDEASAASSGAEGATGSAAGNSRGGSRSRGGSGGRSSAREPADAAADGHGGVPPSGDTRARRRRATRRATAASASSGVATKRGLAADDSRARAAKRGAAAVPSGSAEAASGSAPAVDDSTARERPPPSPAMSESSVFLRGYAAGVVDTVAPQPPGGNAGGASPLDLSYLGGLSPQVLLGDDDDLDLMVQQLDLHMSDEDADGEAEASGAESLVSAARAPGASAPPFGLDPRAFGGNGVPGGGWGRFGGGVPAGGRSEGAQAKASGGAAAADSAPGTVAAWGGVSDMSDGGSLWGIDEENMPSLSSLRLDAETDRTGGRGARATTGGVKRSRVASSVVGDSSDGGAPTRGGAARAGRGGATTPSGAGAHLLSDVERMKVQIADLKRRTGAPPSDAGSATDTTFAGPFRGRSGSDSSVSVLYEPPTMQQLELKIGRHDVIFRGVGPFAIARASVFESMSWPYGKHFAVHGKAAKTLGKKNVHCVIRWDASRRSGPPGAATSAGAYILHFPERNTNTLYSCQDNAMLPHDAVVELGVGHRFTLGEGSHRFQMKVVDVTVPHTIITAAAAGLATLAESDSSPRDSPGAALLAAGGAPPLPSPSRGPTLVAGGTSGGSSDLSDMGPPPPRKPATALRKAVSGDASMRSATSQSDIGEASEEDDSDELDDAERAARQRLTLVGSVPGARRGNGGAGAGATTAAAASSAAATASAGATTTSAEAAESAATATTAATTAAAEPAPGAPAAESSTDAGADDRL